MRIGLSFLLVCGLVSAPNPAAASGPTAQAIGDLLKVPDPLVIGGEPLEGPKLRALYESRNHQPLWIAGTDLTRVDQVAAWIGEAATANGLDAGNYHLAQIAARHPAADERAASELDVLVSDGVLRFVSDVRTGRRPPAQRTAEVDIVQRPLDVVALVRDAAAAGDLRGALEQLPPRGPEYQGLREVLARYRKIAESGGWESLPAADLKPGVSSPAVSALRRRLVVEGDLPDTAASSELYDEELKNAVRRFQQSHGLAADGLVGKPTREALNVPVTQRIDQIRANLERLRWFPEDLGARHVRVNVADFSLHLVEHGVETLEMPVIVGKADWRTPVVSSQIEQLVFNPPWNVPPNIIRKEMIGHVRANPAYFDRMGLRVLRGGGAIDSSAVDWGNTGVGSFQLQQPPGPKNPLGRVKFQFPNVNGVYLHDTNNKGAFRAGFRAMSHGCIRVGDALGLARQILAGDSATWDADRDKALIKDWKTRWVPLATPVPVHVMYDTVWIDPDGTTHFARDFYGRDDRLVEDLKKKNAPVYAPAPPPTVAPVPTQPANNSIQPTGTPLQTVVSGSPAT